MQLAAVFPGQGSQSLGMLAELAGENNEIRETFEEASDLIGKDYWAMVNAEDAGELNQTVNTQPIMLAAGIAVWRTWLAKGGCMPVAMAGHSLGEYSALVASGVLGFRDAVVLVNQRAIFMQQAVPEGIGGMAAILGLDDDDIVKICTELSVENSLVEAVNFNSPGQVVIAGNAEAVDKAMTLMIEAGAKRAIKLPVSVPSHCSLMKPAAEQLAEILNTVAILSSAVPVVQNVAATIFKDEKGKREALSQQLNKPVLWVDTINTLETQYGVDTIIEFGPGKVLFGLNRRINRKLGNFYISDNASMEKALEMCNS